MNRGRVGGLGTPSSSGERGAFFPPELSSTENLIRAKNSNETDDEIENENENGSGSGSGSKLQALPMKGGKNRYANISPSPTDDNDAVKNALKNPFLIRKNTGDKNGNDNNDQNRKNSPKFGKISKPILNTQFSTDVDGSIGTLKDFDLHQFQDKVLQADSVRQSEDLNDINSNSTSFEIDDIDNTSKVKNSGVININNADNSKVNNINNDITDNNDNNDNDNDDNETLSTNGSSSDVKKFEKEKGKNSRGSTGSARSSAERDDIIDLRNKRIDVVSTQARTHTHAYILTYIHTYIHTHTHTHLSMHFKTNI